MADKLIVLVQGRRYNSPTPIDTSILRSVVDHLEALASEHVTEPPEVDATESGWVRFTITLGDDE